MDRLTRTSFAVAVGSAILFGIWPACMKGIYAGGGTVAFALLVTTWIRALVMTAFCVVRKHRLFGTRAIWRQAITGGAFQAISLATLFSALLFLPGPVVIIILFSHTLMLLFFMAWRGEIRLDMMTAAVTASALLGLSLVLDILHGMGRSSLFGIALAFIAAVATVSRLYVYGHQTKERHPIAVGAENYLVAAVMLSPAILWLPVHGPATEAGQIFTVLGAGAQTLATFGMFYGIAMMGAFRWSLYAKMEPLFTALFSALLLGEILKPSQYLGIGVVLGSLGLYQIMEQRGKKAAAS